MIKEKSYGPNQLARMFEGNPNMQKVIWSLWREYYGLYLEKYKKKPEYDDDGNLVDPWLINKISDDISYALALGQDNDMNGNRSFALGQGLVTKSFMEIVLGAYNKIPEGQNAEEWIPSDLLLTLGNGPDKDHRSNVFEIFKNGLFRFLQAIVIGAYPALEEGEDPIPGAIQFTPENGFEKWNDETKKWEPFGGVTIIENHTTYESPINNWIYYDTTYQTYYTYINNEWVSLDQEPETIYPESDNETLNGKHTHKFNPGKLVTQTAHAFIVGNTIKRDGEGNWIKSKADTRENAGTVGIVSEVIDADHFRYITGGLLPGDFVDGAWYWLSVETAGEIFIQSEPEVWDISGGKRPIREFIGTGTANGLEVEIDLGDEIVEMDLGGGGASNDVVSGAGMDFETNAPVTLGTPSEVNSTTINEVTEHSHTHKLGKIDISKILKFGDGYGALYNWYAATDSRNIANVGWSIGDYNQYQILADYLGASGDYYHNTVGRKLKEIGTTYWTSPNTGATNEVRFNARGSGNRDSSGIFNSINGILNIWGTIEFDLGINGFTAAINYSNDWLFLGQVPKTQGCSLRLIKDSTTLTNGQTGTYTGNDGRVYRTICIGTQEWLADNLLETKFRNGDWITGYDGGVYTPISDEDWVSLDHDGMCYYDDNEANGGGETPLENLLISEHNKLQGLQGGDPENDEFYHLTQQQFNNINDSVSPKSASSTASGTNLSTGSIQNTVLPSSPCQVVYAELAWVLFGGSDYDVQQDMGKIIAVIDYNNNGNPILAYKHIIQPTHTRISSILCSINYNENSWSINSMNLDFDCVGDNLPYRIVIQGFYINY